MELRTAAPRIPDHEVLRCIGKGSYGEVWLARAVTGTLRAVKVVHREDFELDRTFEREFEGIMKFEPISRDHPGLVHVLHVGRNDEEKFYYYVMELADDRERGSRVDAADYEARTMGTDKTTKNRLPVSDCLEHGAQLAEGLAHLHECGLTHRDIKPSNIIFVNGKAKLADIGLVAAAGQMTFVGTEGFVPPEGPGTKLADIYSLGMVLYEMSTGKDRLQFPELPDDLGDPRGRPQWHALNEIILRSCANQPKKRFPTAREMALALRTAGRKSNLVRGNWVSRLVYFPVVTATIGFALVTWRHHGAMPWPPGRFADKQTGISPPPPLLTGYVKVDSVPASAEIYYDGNMVGRTPFKVEVATGSATLLLKKDKYKNSTLTVDGVESGKEKNAGRVDLDFYNPPVEGIKDWENSLGMVFDPLPDATHISRRALGETQFFKVESSGKYNVLHEVTSDGAEIYMIQLFEPDILRFCSTLTTTEQQNGWLSDDLCYWPVIHTTDDPAVNREGGNFYRLAVGKYGSFSIESSPQGALIFENHLSEPVGVTPMEISRHRPGPLELTLVLPGFQETKVYDPPESSEVPVLESGKHLSLHAEMRQSSLAVFGKRWKNSQGQAFQSINEKINLLVGEREVKVKDFGAFAAATGLKIRPNDMKQTGDHPVVNVTRKEARDYCEWLTRQEREAGYLNESMEYRLPTDVEWSRAAYSPNLVIEQVSPAQRHRTITGVYPWPSRYFPPPMATKESNRPAANLGDLTALKDKAISLDPAAAGELEALKYNDGVGWTAPVGSFPPNKNGLFDISGNVWEFVSDDFGAPPPKPAVIGQTDSPVSAAPTGPAEAPDRSSYAVLRGGSWKTPATDPEQLATHYRRAIPPDDFGPDIGFRMVVAPVLQEEPLLPPPATFPGEPGPGRSTPFPLIPPFNSPYHNTVPTLPAPGNGIMSPKLGPFRDPARELEIPEERPEIPTPMPDPDPSETGADPPIPPPPSDIPH